MENNLTWCFSDFAVDLCMGVGEFSFPLSIKKSVFLSRKFALLTILADRNPFARESALHFSFIYCPPPENNLFSGGGVRW